MMCQIIAEGPEDLVLAKPHDGNLVLGRSEETHGTEVNAIASIDGHNLVAFLDAALEGDQTDVLALASRVNEE